MHAWKEYVKKAMNKNLSPLYLHLQTTLFKQNILTSVYFNLDRNLSSGLKLHVDPMKPLLFIIFWKTTRNQCLRSCFPEEACSGK